MKLLSRDAEDAQLTSTVRKSILHNRIHKILERSAKLFRA